MNPADRIAPASNVVATPLPGELVLLQLNTGFYFGLDEIGARCWTLLVTDGLCIADAAAKISAEYDVAPAQAQEDLLALVASLRKAQLVAPRP
jgi:hypothetical protein